jgi:hypothetical protein
VEEVLHGEVGGLLEEVEVSIDSMRLTHLMDFKVEDFKAVVEVAEWGVAAAEGVVLEEVAAPGGGGGGGGGPGGGRELSWNPTDMLESLLPKEKNIYW